MPPPLALSDEMLSTLLTLAEPLRRDQRGAFLQAVARRLRHEEVVGEGSVSRIARELQRLYLLAQPMRQVSKTRRF